MHLSLTKSMQIYASTAHVTASVIKYSGMNVRSR